MANNNPRNARTGAPRQGGNRTAFYAVLIAIAVIGIGAILYFIKSPTVSDGGAEADAAYAALQRNYASAGPAQPYVLGNPKAPVLIEEFADYECPQCGRFSTITEPDVRQRLIDTGEAYYKYYDFPLPQHKNSQAASNAAACADEQGKFWQMHDALFEGQPSWGLDESTGGATEVTNNPKSIFLGYAAQIGLNTKQWEQCFDAHKYQSRVNANLAEGFRRHINETPTFYVNGKPAQPAGALPFDALKAQVDAAAAASGAHTDTAK